MHELWGLKVHMNKINISMTVYTKQTKKINHANLEHKFKTELGSLHESLIPCNNGFIKVFPI